MPRKKKEAPTRKNKQYEVKVEVGKKIDGTTIRKSFYSPISKADAQRKAEEYKIEMEVANRTGEGFIDKDVTFAEWAVKWMEIYKKPDVDENTYYSNYWNTVNNHLIPYFKNTPLHCIRPIDIKQFYTLKQNMSGSLLTKIRVCLNNIFETAIDNNLCYKNPARAIKFVSTATKNIKEVYTDAEIETVENIAATNMPEVVLLLETGLRRGELLGLKWEDIDFTSGTISVNRTIAEQNGGGIIIKPPKHDSYRTNPLSIRAIKTLLNLNSKHEGYIFLNKNNSINMPTVWSKKLKRFMNKLPPDIPRLSAHELRHTYGTYLRRHGVDIYTIQKIMGHKDIRVTTEIYVHNEIEVLKNALVVLDSCQCIESKKNIAQLS